MPTVRALPGVYVPTATMVAATWSTLRPFVLERPDQFRPGPPAALASPEWASDYNEVKTYGSRNSAVRTAGQTESARFWLMTGPQAYHPLARQLIAARHMTLVDSARLMASFAVAMTDAYIAVFDAKYHYEFWRPITAIRNGDIDDNPATEIDASWQPLESTPLHPEYPCAHCILSGTAAALLKSYGGLRDLQEISLTSPTLPGVTHRWSSLDAFTAEVANVRVWGRPWEVTSGVMFSRISRRARTIRRRPDVMTPVAAPRVDCGHVPPACRWCPAVRRRPRHRS